MGIWYESGLPSGGAARTVKDGVQARERALLWWYASVDVIARGEKRGAASMKRVGAARRWGRRRRGGRGRLLGLEPRAALAAAHDRLDKRKEPVPILSRRDRADLVLHDKPPSVPDRPRNEDHAPDRHSAPSNNARRASRPCTA